MSSGLHVWFATDGRHLAYVKNAGLHLCDRLAQKEVGQDLGGDERIRLSPDGRQLVTHEERGDNEPFRLTLAKSPSLETTRRIEAIRGEMTLKL